MRPTVSLLTISAALVLLPDSACAQLVIDTVAGGLLRSGVPANDVLITSVGGISWNAAGDLVICEPGRNVIRRVRSRVIETVGGNGTTGFAPDGVPARQAALNNPVACRYDTAGNVYFVDAGNSRIRRIDVAGVLTTVAGNGIGWSEGMDVEGPARSVSLGSVTDLAPAPDGTIYFSSDHPVKQFIGKVTNDGRVEAVAPGNGNIAVDGRGNLFLTLQRNSGEAIRRVGTDGTVTDFAGFGEWTGQPAEDENKPAADVYIQGIDAIAADAQGNIYITQQPQLLPRNPLPVRLRRIDANGTIRTIATRGSQHLAVDSKGNLAFSEIGPPRPVVRMLSSEGVLSPLAGADPTAAPDGIPARQGWLLSPSAIAINRAGEIFIAETGACIIREVGIDGVMRTLAGTGKCASSPVTEGRGQDLPPPIGIALDSHQRVHISDSFGSLYRLAEDGTITPVPLPPPLGARRVVFDAKDRLYSLELLSLTRVSSSGELERIVTPPSEPGIPPSGFGPTSLALLGTDARGMVYFTGTYPGAGMDYLFRVEDDGKVTQVYRGALPSFGSLVVDSTSTAWLAAGSLSVLNASGNWTMGRGFGYSGDGGPLQQARLEAQAIALSSTGDLYILDSQRVRRISGPRAATPAIAGGGIVNAVSYSGGAIAPGEVISIFGSNFGPGGLLVNLPENNQLPSSGGSTRVWIDGIPASIAAVTPNQINAFAPAVLQPGKMVNVVVMVDAAASAPVAVPVAVAAPGVSPWVLNQDGSINSQSTPAAQGSIVALFGTGAGKMGSRVSGDLTLSTPYPLITDPVKVTVSGRDAEITYAGAAPLQPFGVFQINVRIPEGVMPGDAAVFAGVAGIASKPITISIR